MFVSQRSFDAHVKKDEKDLKRIRKQLDEIFRALQKHGASVEDSSINVAKQLRITNELRDLQHLENQKQIAAIKRVIWIATGIAATMLFIAKDIIVPLIAAGTIKF